MTTQDLAHAIVDTLAEKKGEDIILLDVHEITSFTDYFIICTGTSNRMLKALADSVLEMSRLKYTKKTQPEGNPDSGWIVMDYGDIVVHLLNDGLRRYYNLEEFWNQGKIVLRLQ